MRYYLFTLCLIITYSCTDKNHPTPDKKISNNHAGEKAELNQPIQEIGSFYQPEEMTIKEKQTGKSGNKEDYQITLKNSDLLDSDLENLNEHAKKIASLYYKSLTSTIHPLNLKKVVVTIKHRNLKIDNFEYLEENIK